MFRATVKPADAEGYRETVDIFRGEFWIDSVGCDTEQLAVSLADQINAGAKVLAAPASIDCIYTIGRLGPPPEPQTVLRGLHIDLFSHMGLGQNSDVARYYHLLAEAVQQATGKPAEAPL